jgi:hypothetical protein
VIEDIKSCLEQVCSGFSEKTQEVQYSYPAWTKAIKESLCELGSQKSFITCANGISNSTFEEWLFDVTWLEYQDGNLDLPLLSIPFAAESEWGDSRAIRNDFEKLIVSRAKLRLMIFEKRDKQSVATEFDALSELVHAFQHDGLAATYLLAGFSGKDRGFFFREV